MTSSPSSDPASASNSGGTNTSEAANVGSARLPSKSTKQRFKPQLSCTFCRSRKLKCDRNLPCENCVKRDFAASCSYVHRQSPNIRKTGTGSGSHDRNRDVQGRIQHLERLVISLMTQTNSHPNVDVPENAIQDQRIPQSDYRIPDIFLHRPPPYWTDAVTLREAVQTIGRLRIDGEEEGGKGQNYVGGSHWEAILDNIAGLKDVLTNTEADEEEGQHGMHNHRFKGPDLLVGDCRNISKTEILYAIPEKSITDVLIRNYFESMDMASVMIHGPTFRREYDRFWQDPDGTSVVWIGLLFGVLTLSTHFATIAGKKLFDGLPNQTLRDPEEIQKIYREKIVQCLILGNYCEPGPYVVEALMLYFVVEHCANEETHFGIWMVFGLIVRLAMRMGFHRDPSQYPNISVFRGEMQRRLWAVIAHLDLQTSCQVGLPRMIKEGMADTKQPRHLIDEDFDEDTKVLPPGRPFSEATPIGYSIIKHSITAVFGMIVDQANSTLPIKYDEVMRLDTLLNDNVKVIPQFLRVHSLDDLGIGAPDVRVRKFALDICYQKARCVLHRKFLAPSERLERYSYSIKTCVDASMQILHCQEYMWNQTAPGKSLQDFIWKTSSLTTTDFFLAAMLLCLYLGNNITISPSVGIPIRWSREDMLKALDDSCKVWDMTPKSKDVMKVAKAMRTMVKKVRDAGRNLSFRFLKDLHKSIPANNHQNLIFHGMGAPTDIIGSAGLVPRNNSYTYNASSLALLISLRGGSIEIINLQLFPVASQSRTAIVMIKPGVMREIHWTTNQRRVDFLPCG
ncbi:hypothetical protein B7494_g733 [Chlorociboria aeruginascens]|nr:hypothetical protein B7494_g733 [Chlorociboria aeruginascens]